MSGSRAPPFARRLGPRSFRLPRRPHACRWRGYASKEEAPNARFKTLKSDLPWLAGAVLFTVPATYAILQSGPIGHPYYHPMPGDNWHPDKEEGEEPDEGSQEGMEIGEGGIKSHDEEDDEDEGGDDGDAQEKSEEDESEGAKDQGASETESQPDDEAAEEGQSPESSDAKGSEQDSSEDSSTEEEEAGDTGKYEPGGKLSPRNRDAKQRIYSTTPDAKGGVKRKIEGDYARKQGEADDSSDQDTPAASGKEAKQGHISSKQKGLSNTDTKHAHDFSGEQNLSKKSEGTPETAKLQGTVDPKRKSV
ncbi:MAG: hypothetical protein M1828_000705 [Chrysothrix sp. TS-e1954]|nr:MAG: hypothetical protein M1828_000705 [Chrysothrix sp. TS-e1954]